MPDRQDGFAGVKAVTRLGSTSITRQAYSPQNTRGSHLRVNDHALFLPSVAFELYIQVYVGSAAPNGNAPIPIGSTPETPQAQDSTSNKCVPVLYVDLIINRSAQGGATKSQNVIWSR